MIIDANLLRAWILQYHIQMARSALDEMSDSGAFKRTASTFRNLISRDPKSQFPAESGRYHLYVSYACPWASRCLAYLKIKGLENAISFTVCSIVIFLRVVLQYDARVILFFPCCSVGQTDMGKNQGEWWAHGMGFSCFRWRGTWSWTRSFEWSKKY